MSSWKRNAMFCGFTVTSLYLRLLVQHIRRQNASVAVYSSVWDEQRVTNPKFALVGNRTNKDNGRRELWAGLTSLWLMTLTRKGRGVLVFASADRVLCGENHTGVHLRHEVHEQTHYVSQLSLAHAWSQILLVDSHNRVDSLGITACTCRSLISTTRDGLITLPSLTSPTRLGLITCPSLISPT